MSEIILVLSHVEEDGGMGNPARETITVASNLATGLGSGYMLGLFGRGVDRVTECGATRYLSVTGEDFGNPRYMSDAAAAVALIKESGATLILAPATSRMSRIIAGVAQRVEGQVDTQVTGIESVDSTISVTRWYYRQRMAAQISREGRPWLITLSPGCVEPFVDSGTSASPSFESLEGSIGDTGCHTVVKGIEATSGDAQTIRPEADVLFVAGAGWTKKQSDGMIQAAKAEELILDFISKEKASLGSSKSLVDLGSEGQDVLSFLTHLHQIGQTGSTPRHKKGLATCCHGEEPHAVGWRFVQERRAVNLDANCGWAHGKADVLYVADAFAVMERVNQLLSG